MTSDFLYRVSSKRDRWMNIHSWHDIHKAVFKSEGCWKHLPKKSLPNERAACLELEEDFKLMLLWTCSHVNEWSAFHDDIDRKFHVLCMRRRQKKEMRWTHFPKDSEFEKKRLLTLTRGQENYGEEKIPFFKNAKLKFVILFSKVLFWLRA